MSIALKKPLCLAALVWLAGLLGSSAFAQDVFNPLAAKPRLQALAAATGPRTSPFNPPDKDVFLTDAGPGLDTGCTFNSSPLNPLTIDVVIDRFVGDVDANGFLVNPAPLIAAGIVPASVDIILPAYDVDFNGVAPPERDEILLNGTSLGFLTGDNIVWKLNTFNVNIGKIKFPKRPAAGAAPTPVSNRLQIRIDTLSSNRWCTQVDWVAFVLPIRPKLGLDLEVVAGNPIKSTAGVDITKIQEETFDADCKLTTKIGPYELYPFSGAASAVGGAGTARLKAKLTTCPDQSIAPPKVNADWTVEAGTTLKGTTTWTGFEGTVEYRMPPEVGAYKSTLKLTLDNGQTVSAERKLFVTKYAPLVADPRINWYEKGTTWAKGQIDEDNIVSKVLDGEYGYGNASWRYGYFPGTCSWQQLVDNPLVCNYSDCYVFSDVLENISGTLGVGGLAAVKVEGANSIGFLTTGSPSIDPAFKGNSRPLGTTTYDRYRFSSHSLRKRGGTYYDATFRGKYGTSTQFIAFNLNSTVGTDANGSWRGTDEGKRIYARPGNAYDSWGINDYAFRTLTPFPLLASLSLEGMSAQGVQMAAVTGPLLQFPGSASYRTIDTNADGRFDALEVTVDVDVLAAGDYVIVGALESGGLPVANRPAFDSMTQTRADLSGGPGRRAIMLRFSGEQIRQSRLNGPYTLVLSANSATSAAGSASIVTPAFSFSAFGEKKASLRSLSPVPTDVTGSGRFGLVRLGIEVDAATAGPYQFKVTLGGGGTDLVSTARLAALAQGVQTLVVDLPATAILRAGRSGPYDVTVSVSDALGATVDSQATVLPGYLASQFEGLVEVNGSLIEEAIDSNGNNLVDILRVSADIASRASRSFALVATLIGSNNASVGAEALVTLPAGTKRVPFEFRGPELRRLQMQSQLMLALSFRDPATMKELDSIRIPLRGAYIYTQFDTGEVPRAIALNGTRSDRGVDLNANGLFDQLAVDLGVDLTGAGAYEWSARLVDKSGIEIGFATGRGSLPAGAATVRLTFDGRLIGSNGFDGPYFIRGLLISGPSGANLVSTFAGETSMYRANQFEGFVQRVPGDLNGDGVVNTADVALFNNALGSSIGDAKFNSLADFDRDGRITLNDLRIFRSLLPRR